METELTARVADLQLSRARADVLSFRQRRVDDLRTLLRSERRAIAQLKVHNGRCRAELDQRQHNLAVAASLLHSTAAQHMRRLPSVLQTRRSLLHSLSSSVSRLEHRRLSLLFSLYELRRATTSTCTLLELPIPDDLELLPMQDEESLPSALGYLLLVVHLSAVYLRHPLPFAMHFLASKSSLTHLGHTYVLSPVAPDMRAQPADRYRKAVALLAHNVVALCKAGGMGDVRLWRVAGNVMDLLQAVRIRLGRHKTEADQIKKDAWDKAWNWSDVREGIQPAQPQPGQKDKQNEEEDEEEEEAEAQPTLPAPPPLVVDVPPPSALLHTVSAGYDAYGLGSPPASIGDKRPPPSSGPTFAPPTPSSSAAAAVKPTAYSYFVAPAFRTPSIAPSAISMANPPTASAAAAGATVAAAGTASAAAPAPVKAKTKTKKKADPFRAIAVSNLEDDEWDMIEIERRDEWDD